MRKILFCGKRTDNGKWVIGMLCQYHEGIKAIIADNHFGTFEGTSETYVVIPDTVGQFTGLTDKNGKRIFEGDIVQRDFGEEQIGKQNAIVYYNSKNHAFLLNPVDDWMFTALDDCEVIGNIHDNRELLKGAD